MEDSPNQGYLSGGVATIRTLFFGGGVYNGFPLCRETTILQKEYIPLLH